MRQNIDPERVLRNLRTIIEEAEKACAQEGGGGMDEDRLSELRERVQAGFNRLRQYYDDLGGRVSACYNDTEDRLRDYYEEVEERLRSGIEATDTSLRLHPYRMAAVTFGAGLVLGMLARSRASR